MTTIGVTTRGGRYPIIIERGLLARTGPALKALGFSEPPIVIGDSRALGIHGKALLPSLERAFGRALVIRIAPGEHAKSRHTLFGLYDALLRRRAHRGSWIIAFGGGVVSDVAGFSAATYLRGIRYVNVPTTLLAQIDSAIGGKVGINLGQGKNLVGAFHQPSAVLSDPEVLSSLPARELSSGLYEVVKCAAIRSPRLTGFLEARLPEVIRGEAAALQRVVVETARIKAAIISGDEKERGKRMILNFGHTIGHALEAATAYERFTHGEAIAWGMIGALALGVRLGISPPSSAARIVRLIRAVGRLPGLDGIPAGDLWNAFERDKKFRGGRIRMVLLARTGAVRIIDDMHHAGLKRFLRSFLARKGDFAALSASAG